MIKEDLDISQAIKQKISQEIDNWVNDLIRQKIVTPTINSNLQRGLWDRLKGALSNAWHGRYNQNNPNYWRNRFGDDLGAQEAYDPRAFSLKEYNEIRSVIKETETIIEQESAGDIEKLRIVQIIRSAAEELKQKLYSIFVRSCSSQGPSEPTQAADRDSTPSSEEPPAEDTSTGETQAEDPEETPSGTPMTPTPVSSTVVPPPEDIKPTLKLNNHKYIVFKPKERSKSMSIEKLWDRKHLTDLILHKDFENEIWNRKPAHELVRRKEEVLREMDDLLHDAELKNRLGEENKRIVKKIQEAREKLLELMKKSEE